MHRAFGIVVGCTLVAACAAVPEVTYDDDRDGAVSEPTFDAQPPPDVAVIEDAAADAVTPKPPPDAGPPPACGGKLKGSELCCGSGICDTKDCMLGQTGGRCQACGQSCVGKRCCFQGASASPSSCVAYDAECPK